tara:strand:+ start:288 stop:932 length:645 start_codon:yes stop_codon:yes gene_type:complete
MIEINNLSKSYKIKTGRNVVFKNLNLNIHPSQKLALIGKNGTGKSTLIRLISGADHPSSGTITRNMSVSWPLAFGDAFQGSLTGIDNTRFICRVYNKSFEGAIDYVRDFTELGNYLSEPVKKYSSGMRAKLAFAISMLVNFDCYLIDEITAVGDYTFQKKCDEELFIKRSNSSMIIASHDENLLRERCDSALLFKNGHVSFFDNIDEAFNQYNK